MSREPFELDPDEARVRALIRRSDGPVTVRPLRRYASRMSALPVALGAVGLLVIGLVIGTALGARRQEVASPPVATGGIAPAATHTPSPTATPAPTTATGPGVPISAGAVPAAGVLFIRAADGLIYRYSGETGSLTSVSSGSMTAETRSGVNVLTPDGRADALQWDGGGSRDICGPGRVVAVSPLGVCAFQAPGDPVQVMVPRMRAVAVPAEWGHVDVTFDESGSKLAVVRPMPGDDPEDRAHNSLWVWDWEQGGQLRKLYEPSSPAAHISSPQWSPDGQWLTVLELATLSNSIAADGWRLLIVNVATARVTELGTTIGADWVQWSPEGQVAYVIGAGRETWSNKQLYTLDPDGDLGAVAVRPSFEERRPLPDPLSVTLAPAWSGSGDLAFVYGPSAPGPIGSDYMQGIGTGDRRGMVISPDRSVRSGLACSQGALEGIRPSADGQSYLLLCRAPGDDPYPFSLWLATLGGRATELVTGLGWSDTGGFGYYGKHPHLETITAWSLAAR